jgi:hypothetical protein
MTIMISSTGPMIELARRCGAVTQVIRDLFTEDDTDPV